MKMGENKEVKETKAVECPICGTLLKNRAGLAGHMRIEHGFETKKTFPDEIGRRLEVLEKKIQELSQKMITPKMLPEILGSSFQLFCKDWLPVELKRYHKGTVIKTIEKALAEYNHKEKKIEKKPKEETGSQFLKVEHEAQK